MQEDFKAKVEIEFGKMISSVSSKNLFGIKSSRSHIQRQFGPDEKWVDIYNRIYSFFRDGESTSIYLSDVNDIARQGGVDIDDALAVIAVLSRPSIGLLAMSMEYDNHKGQKSLTWEDFNTKLSDWWKKKTIDDLKWNEWAGSILVKWTILNEERIQ